MRGTNREKLFIGKKKRKKIYKRKKGTTNIEQVQTSLHGKYTYICNELAIPLICIVAIRLQIIEHSK